MKHSEINKIKNNAQLLMKIGGVIVLSNTFGVLVFLFLGFDTGSLGIEELVHNPISFLFRHFIRICVTMIALGILFIYGAYHMKRLRLWSNKLLSWVSILLIIAMWIISVFVLFVMNSFDTTIAPKFIVIATAIVWSIPFMYFINYLNKKDVKKYFK